MTRSSAPFTLELTLLGILDRTPMHGYNLCKAVQALDGFGMIWKIKQSSLYALVDKLEASGLLEATVIEGASHPSRRELRVTPAGRVAFEVWVGSPVDSIRNMRQDFFARLYFARREGPDRARALVGAQREACLAWREDILGKLRAGGGEHLRTVLSHRIQIVEATLAWLDDAYAAS